MTDPIESARQAVAEAETRLDELEHAAEMLRDGLPRARLQLESARAALRRTLQSDADRVAAARARELASIQRQIEDCRNVR